MRFGSLLILGFATSLAMLPVAGATGSSEAADAEVVAADGTISLPKDFRRRYVHLGSWFVPEGEASGFHDVYADPQAVDGYRESGRFPDGAVLVKELRPARSADYSTGAGVGHATSELKQWFVMVKDGSDRFPGNPLWGHGWGWGLFKPDAPERNVATGYAQDCLGCHLPAQANDLVYVEAYPTLTR